MLRNDFNTSNVKPSPTEHTIPSLVLSICLSSDSEELSQGAGHPLYAVPLFGNYRDDIPRKAPRDSWPCANSRRYTSNHHFIMFLASTY